MLSEVQCQYETLEGFDEDLQVVFKTGCGDCPGLVLPRIDLQKIVARVTFYTAGRKILMRVYSSSSNRARQYFKKFSGAVSAGVLTVDNIVLPRTETPWGVINYGLFDLIKPDTKN